MTMGVARLASVQIRELSIPGAFEVTPVQHRDERGIFLEWYRFDRLEEVLGHSLDLRQGNSSVSSRGVLRGIHFADVPRGQAKYVTVTGGSVIDFVVDVRVGSPTFGQWDSVILDDVDRRAVYIAEGLGHAFLTLSETATVVYLVSDTYNPTQEHSISPVDPQVALEFPKDITDLVISPKDMEAPSLAEAMASGQLPTMESALSRYAELDGRGN
jgi:dTDP-4-dehydrorhamnose 3,5-epimerase